jgi:hypothetical protein
MIKKVVNIKKVAKLEKEYVKLIELVGFLESKLHKNYNKLRDCFEWCSVNVLKINKLLKVVDADYKKLKLTERTLNKLHNKLHNN